MVPTETVFEQIATHIDAVLQRQEPMSSELLQQVSREHPADIALLVEQLDDEQRAAFLKLLDQPLSSNVFERLPLHMQQRVLQLLDTDSIADILHNMSLDLLTDLLDELGDKELKEYLRLLQKKERQAVLSLLDFDPYSAGGIMNTEVVTLHNHITVRQAINLLQRIQPGREHLQRLFVTTRSNVLVGYIRLEDLLVHKPETPIAEFIQKPELVIDVHEDQEEVAKDMHHYDLLVAPVIDIHEHFLGVITADSIFDIIEREASEDVYKLSGITATPYPYFEISFWQLLWQRTPWLIGLLILQSVSSFIMGHYQMMLASNIILATFSTMLIGTGGNAGNQSGALVVRGLTTGEIDRSNTRRVLWREFKIALVIAVILTIVAFFRVYLDPRTQELAPILAICSSLFVIVIASVMLGTFLPLLFERLNIDPAHTAAPFLATLMDIIGIFLYCVISSYILT